MSDEAMKLLDDLDWAEKVVKRKSVEAAEAQNALGEAMDERAQASRRVAAMIRANHSSSISFGGNVYALRQGDVVERIPMVIAQDCKVPDEGLDAGEFILRWWGRGSQRFGYLGRDEDGDEAIVHDKSTAFRFSSIAQAEQFRTDRELTHWEVARFDDPVGPPIDAESEELTAEQIIEAVNSQEPRGPFAVRLPDPGTGGMMFVERTDVSGTIHFTDSPTEALAFDARIFTEAWIRSFMPNRGCEVFDLGRVPSDAEIDEAAAYAAFGTLPKDAD